LPSFIEQEEKRITEINKDLPVLQEVVNGTWSKEDRLNELKTKLAGIERKIQLSIIPKMGVADQKNERKISEKHERKSMSVRVI